MQIALIFIHNSRSGEFQLDGRNVIGFTAKSHMSHVHYRAAASCVSARLASERERREFE